MTANERLLRLLLRAEAVLLLCALPAAVMPTGWMDTVARAAGLAPVPRAPLVEYLTRSLSLLYAAWAPVCWLCAADVRRYRELILVTAWVRVLFGAALLGLDLAVGMPLPWTVAEGPVVLVLGGLVLLLARGVPPDGAD